MCGIVGFVGADDAVQRVMSGLQCLEYRGYDSAGVATIENHAIALRRCKGKLVGLKELLRQKPIGGAIALGHTRWATHGPPSEENAHPHWVDDIVLVHNGIIENYLELRTQLQSMGRHFASQTDSEIIAHLIAMQKGTLLQRVRQALASLHGAYALVIMSINEPEHLVVAKNASPLVIGMGTTGCMVASDIPALLPLTRDVVILGEGQMAQLSANTLDCYDIHTGNVVQPVSKHITWSPSLAEKGGFKHYMLKEIFEQPRAIEDCLRGRIRADNAGVLLEPEVTRLFPPIDRIVLTACGTSYYAAMVGRLMIESLAKIPCDIELASELRYRNPVIVPNTLTLAVSQSGETADTLAAIKMMSQAGCPILAVVNSIDSSIAREASGTLYTHAGPEIGVASTKAFLSQCVALFFIAAGLATERGISAASVHSLLQELRHIPQRIEAILAMNEPIRQVAQSLLHCSSTLFLGRGFGFPVALEGALKLKEISYIHAEGYASGEMKHGPIALIEKDFPVIAIATQSPLYDKVLSNLQEVHARGAHLLAIASDNDAGIGQICQQVILVPQTSTLLSPLIDTVALQLLAYHVADSKHLDVDQPRNLAKSVTVE